MSLSRMLGQDQEMIDIRETMHPLVEPLQVSLQPFRATLLVLSELPCNATLGQLRMICL